MNTELRKNAEHDSEKDYYKLMNNAVYGETMENVRKHKTIKLVIKNAKRKKLVSEPNYHTTKWFSENLLAIEMKKHAYLGLAILSFSKIKMYEYWYDEMKPKYGDRIKLCYMDTNSFILKQKVFINILLIMLKKRMIHQVILLKEHYQWVKIKK